MLLQTQPNEWSCLPTAFAIITDQSVNDLIALIGHDGSEMILPNQAVIKQAPVRRGFHPQEIIWALHDQWNVTEHTDASLILSEDTEEVYEVPMISLQERFKQMRSSVNGVYAYCTFSGGRHATAWDCVNGVFIDPKNGDYTDAVEGVAELFWSVERRCQTNQGHCTACQRDQQSSVSHCDAVRPKPHIG